MLMLQLSIVRDVAMVRSRALHCAFVSQKSNVPPYRLRFSR